MSSARAVAYGPGLHLNALAAGGHGRDAGMHLASLSMKAR
jgi:hypothetical protein